MNYKKQLRLVGIFSLLFLLYIGWSGYLNEFVNGNCLEIQRSMIRCIDIIFFTEYKFSGMMFVSLLFSILPLFFLKEQVYKTWQKFAIVALPVIALLIFFAPAHSLGPFYYFGYDREVASMLFSVLFLLVSWSIVFRKTLKK